MGLEVWINVAIFGPESEIKRFKAMCVSAGSSASGLDGGQCIDFSPISQRRSGLADGPICNVWDHPWNFRADGDEKPGAYEFSFDVGGEFPVPIFDRLAILFPTLAFHCECISSLDEFMGYGWFNVPEGGEKFAFYDVPDNYWTTGSGDKRDAVAQARHEELVEVLAREARRKSLH